MQTTDRPGGFGLLGSTGSLRPRSRSPSPRAAKRNPWAVIAFFALVVAAWINSLV